MSRGKDDDAKFWADAMTEGLKQLPALRSPIIPALGVLEITTHGRNRDACLGRALDIAHEYFAYPPNGDDVKLIERGSNPVMIDGQVVAYRTRFAAWLADPSVTP